MLFRSITFYYQASTNAWRRVVGGATNMTVANIAVSNLFVGTSIGLTSTEAFDLDDLSNYTDGRTGTFTPTYNGSQISVVNPWNLDVTVNGLRQPAFKYNGDLVWQSWALTANKGYTLDYTGNIKFADTLPARSRVTVTVKPGTNSQNIDRKSTRLNSSHTDISRMPSSA